MSARPWRRLAPVLALAIALAGATAGPALGRQQSSVSKKAGEELRRVARRARDEGRARRVD